MRLFSLSIDEEIRWGFAEADPAYPGLQFIEGSFEQKELVKLPTDEPTSEIDLQHILRDALSDLKIKRADLFKNIDAVGVSSIGVIDTNLREFISISRKPWKRIRGRGKSHDKRGAVISFDELFKGLFSFTRPGALPQRIFSIHNDATAKTLAEYHQYWKEHKHILYLMFDEGVNGGMIYRSGELSTSLHPEIGHILPTLHPRDHDFREIPKFRKGCPSHISCYEGLASLHRIRKAWGPDDATLNFTLDNVDDDVAWNVIAFYVAQLCWTCTLMLSPQRIVLGGRVISPDLIPLVHRHFADLNNGYLYYEEIENPSDFIQRAKMPWEEAGPRGGLLLAHELCQPLRMARLKSRK